MPYSSIYRTKALPIIEDAENIKATRKGTTITITHNGEKHHTRALAQGENATHVVLAELHTRAGLRWKATSHKSYGHALRKASGEANLSFCSRVWLIEVTKDFTSDYDRVIDELERAYRYAIHAGASELVLDHLILAINQANEDFAQNTEGK